jgi:hypothetical protein
MELILTPAPQLTKTQWFDSCKTVERNPSGRFRKIRQNKNDWNPLNFLLLLSLNLTHKKFAFISIFFLGVNHFLFVCLCFHRLRETHTISPGATSSTEKLCSLISDTTPGTPVVCLFFCLFFSFAMW